MDEKKEITIFYLDGTSETRDMTPEEIAELPEPTEPIEP